jgi:hypothetical protein
MRSAGFMLMSNLTNPKEAKIRFGLADRNLKAGKNEIFC